MRRFLFVILSVLSMGTMSFGKINLQYQWKYLDLLWESPQKKQEAIDSGAYNISAAFFYDVDRASGMLKLFKDFVIIRYGNMDIFLHDSLLLLH